MENINPFIPAKSSDDWKKIRTFEYVDEWEPKEGDVVRFTSISNAIIAPVNEFYKNSSQSLNYFSLDAKKCYKSDDMRKHICKCLNYFETFYDEDAEYFAILCQLKMGTDIGIQSPTSSRPVTYTEDGLINEIRRYILSPSITEKVSRMCKDNYRLSLHPESISNPSLRYNERHACVLMECSILINMMIPIVTHFATTRGIKAADDFLLKAYDNVFKLFDDVDIYSKLQETCNTNIGKNEKNNKCIWTKQSIRGKSVSTHTQTSLNILVLNIMPKYIFDKNIINMNHSAIQNNVKYQITDISFEYTFIQLSSSKRDEDNQSDMDKYEAQLIKQDESKYLEMCTCAETSMQLIENTFGPFPEDELQRYAEIFGDNYRNDFQRQLIFYTFYKYFGDTMSINSIDRTSYFKLMIAAKHIYLSHNMIILPYIISGKMEKIVSRKSVNKKELQKVQASRLYPQFVKKYKDERITKILLNFIATVISSQFRIIDENKTLDGHIVNVETDIIIDEFLSFALLI